MMNLMFWQHLLQSLPTRCEEQLNRRKCPERLQEKHEKCTHFIPINYSYFKSSLGMILVNEYSFVKPCIMESKHVYYLLPNTSFSNDCSYFPTENVTKENFLFENRLHVLQEGDLQCQQKVKKQFVISWKLLFPYLLTDYLCFNMLDGKHFFI